MFSIYPARRLPFFGELNFQKRKDMDNERRYAERDFQALADARRFTDLLRSAEPGRSFVLTFPDGRALDSFRCVAYRENTRGESPVCFSLRMSYRNRTARVAAITREEYERAEAGRIDP